MNALNEKTAKTEKVIHIMVTSLCNRNCKHCCNKQYSISDIPYVTDEELKNAHTLCLTGGEPFLYAEPASIAEYYKKRYENIKNVYVYTNAKELSDYLKNNHLMDYIDGVNVSIKTKADLVAFDNIVNDERINKMPSDLLYVFNDLLPKNVGNFTVINREWQKDFVPADDSIFRRI